MRKIFCLLFNLLFSLAMLAGGARAQDPPAFHGMLIFGKKTIYLSHLPMFHAPHDYQVIAEADLPANARQIYLQDQIDHPEQSLYTIAPSENFVLPDEFQNLKSFQATLYRGHFERGGVPIAENVVVEIKKIIYFNHFDPQAGKPDQLTYLIFGHADEIFMAHWIVSKPDFDQIAEVEFNQPLNAAHPYCVAQSIGQNDEQPFEGNPAASQFLDECSNQVFQVSSFKEIYLEFGDLSN
jgi:hypothetical protein